MAVNVVKLARYGWGAVLLLWALALPSLAQDDGATVMWGEEGEAVVAGEPEEEALTELPAEPVLAIAPDGQSVLDFTPPVPSESGVGALAKEILSRPEFQRDIQVQQESLLEKFIRWLQSLPGLNMMTGNNWLILGVLAAFLGLLAYLLVRMAWGANGWRRRSNGTVTKNGKRANGRVDYLDEAEQAAQRRDFRLAVRYRFLAVLQQAGLPDNQLLTNRQVKRQLTERNASVERPLGELITGYEDAWYGGLPCTADAYGGLRLWAEQVERLLEQEQAA